MILMISLNEEKWSGSGLIGVGTNQNFLEEEKTIQSSILAWEVPCTEKPSGLIVIGVTKSHTALSMHVHIPTTIHETMCIQNGNVTPKISGLLRTP